MVGHQGEQTTKMIVGKKIYWPEMKKDVEHFVHTYVKCRNMKSICKKKYGLYRPLRSCMNQGESTLRWNTFRHISVKITVHFTL
jgi:hypothetical protein